MCCITGWVDFEKNLSFSKKTMENMCDAMFKRGTENRTLWLSDNALFGYRSSVKGNNVTKNQPLVKWVGENQYVIVMDGFLYNANELKRYLESKGHTVFSRLAHEIVLEAYIQWKEGIADKLEGVYSFAIWDSQEQTLFICRDHCGAKPLFYYIDETSLIFASEIKGLLAHHAIKPKINKEGLSDILTVSPFRNPGNTVFRDIRELLPAHYIKFSRDSFEVKQYWKLEAEPHEDDIDLTSEKVRFFLMNSVERQLELFPEAGMMLSGGLGSSAVASLICNYYTNNCSGSLQSFSLEYSDRNDFLSSQESRNNPDSLWAVKASGFLNTEHSKVVISSDNLAAALKESMQARDLPGLGDIDSSLLLFCRNISHYTDSSFSGDCADEVFGNYIFKNKRSLRKDSFPWFINQDNKLSILSVEMNKLIKAKEHIRERYFEAVAKTPKLGSDTKAESLKREIAFLDLYFKMPNILERCDRMASTAGIALLLPFCSHKLMQYVYNIPCDMLWSDGIEKGILRRAMKGYVPEEILLRQKCPYPQIQSESYGFALRDILRDILNEPGSPLYALMDLGQLTLLMDNLDNNNYNKTPPTGSVMSNIQLMAHLIQTDMWFKEYNVSIVG